MGGEGSGRKPDIIKKILEAPKLNLYGDDLVIPNYSGVKKEALKTSTGTLSPGGVSGNVQYNNSGSFGGSNNFKYTSNVVTITDSGNTTPINIIAGGDGGYNTYGNLSWSDESGRIAGLLSNPAGIDSSCNGAITLFGDISTNQYLGELAFADRTLSGDKRKAGIQGIYNLTGDPDSYSVLTYSSYGGAGQYAIAAHGYSDGAHVSINKQTANAHLNIQGFNPQLRLEYDEYTYLEFWINDFGNATITNNIGGISFMSPVGFSSTVGFDYPITLKAYTVATLPAGNTGDVAYVTDALAPAFLVAVAGGGAITTPVFYNGTNWVAG